MSLAGKLNAAIHFHWWRVPLYFRLRKELERRWGKKFGRKTKRAEKRSVSAHVMTRKAEKFVSKRNRQHLRGFNRVNRFEGFETDTLHCQLETASIRSSK